MSDRKRTITAAAISLVGALMVVVAVLVLVVARAGILNVVFGGALLDLGIRALIVAVLLGTGLSDRGSARRIGKRR